jgi:hypothetical protein
MRRFALVAVLLAAALCGASSARAQWPFIPIAQSQAKSLNAASNTCVFNQNVTSGNLVLVGISWESSTNTPTVTDTLLSLYAPKFINTANTVHLAVYTTTLASTGANTVTVAITSGGFININCVEVPPLWTLTVDGTAGFATYTGSPATITTPAVGGGGTTLNSDLIFTYIGNDNSAGFQNLQSASLGTWVQVGSSGNADSQAGFLRVGGVAGSGTTVTVDNGGTTGSVVTIAFQSKALAITSAAAAPDGGTTSTYDFTLLSAGGAGAITWSVTGGALPTGLSLNAGTGEITGTPTVSNNYSATFQATDGTHTATKTITFKITTGLNAIALIQTQTTPGPVNGSTSLTFGSSVTAGHTIAVQFNFNATADQISSCTDTLGTSFALVVAMGMKGDNLTQAVLGEILIAAGVAPASGADTVTCPTIATLGQAVAIAEFSNVSYIANDNTAGTVGVDTSPVTITSNALTTLVPNQVIFGACTGHFAGSTNTVNAPFTAIGSALASATAYRIVTSVAGYSLSCNQASNSDRSWLIGIAGFRPTGGTVSPPGGRGPKGRIL